MHIVLYFEDIVYAEPLGSYLHPAFFPVFGKSMISYLMESLAAHDITWYVWGASPAILQRLHEDFPSINWHGHEEVPDRDVSIVYADTWVHGDDILALPSGLACVTAQCDGYLGQIADGDAVTRTHVAHADHASPWMQGVIHFPRAHAAWTSPIEMLGDLSSDDIQWVPATHTLQRIRFPWDVLALQYQLLRLADVRYRVDPTAHIDETAYLGENVVIGKRVQIAENVELSHVVILDDCHIEPNCRIDGSVLGDGVVVREHTIVDGALGEQVSLLGQNPQFQGVFVAPKREVSGFITSPTLIS